MAEGAPPRNRTGAPRRVGVISDTHGLLRPEAVKLLAGVEHIIHAGDIGDPGIVERLVEIAPATVIRGNVDIGEWAEAYPERAELRIAGRRIHVLHDIAELDVDPPREGIDVVVYGHSHKPRVETVDGVLLLNPGAAGRRRFRLPVTLATLELGEARMDARIHTIEA